MGQKDTIVAISTPPGEGGIAVIRVSGAEAVPISQKVFRSDKNVRDFERQKAYHGWVFDRDEPVDEVVLTLFPNPRSYTGENLVEVSCHGGVFVSQRIVDLYIREGARPADPGEFTLRAFLNGKMDLCQAEAVADLIQARTEASRKVATYQLEGRLSERLGKMRSDLIDTCSLLEIELDFSEEDLEFLSREKLVKTMGSLRDEMRSILASYNRGRVCREGIRMVIIGRPNVGKSSILNSLVERERAIVTEVPGTTRDTVEDILDIEGLLFVITDTAGIRESQDPVEKVGVRKAMEALEKADLILIVFDGSELLTEEDKTLIHIVKGTHKKIIAAVNKIDLTIRLDVEKLKTWLPETLLVKLSALKHNGFRELIQVLEKTVLSKGIPHVGEVVLTRTRHRDSLSRAIRGLEQAEASLKDGASQEFIAVDLRESMEALGEITGQTTTSADILEHIFSDFCIGK